MRPIQIEATPITEETFERQGWYKEDTPNDEDDFHYWTLTLPKDSRDPYAPILISSPSNQSVRGLEKGEYVVEMHDFNGLGFCTSEEEIEVLYKVLTKKSIYDK